MKRLFIIAAIVLGMNNSNISAQNVIRNGNTFKVEARNTNRAKADTLVTSFMFDANGITYPIIINKNSGRCYIWKKSKNGKLYRQYMKEEISVAISKEIGVEYKPKK